MAILFATFVAFYFTGVYLVVTSLVGTPEWFEDEEGQLHYLPRSR
ncbi:MAG: hypothetical protein QM790_10430 [Nibricoccus sp.]